MYKYSLIHCPFESLFAGAMLGAPKHILPLSSNMQDRHDALQTDLTMLGLH